MSSYRGVKVSVFGRVGKDPEKRFTESGTPVVSFSLANNAKVSSGQETIWLDCEVWGSLSEIVEQYVQKGDLVYLEGRLKAPRIWTDKQGENRASLGLVVREIELQPKSESESGTNKEKEDIPF